MNTFMIVAATAICVFFGVYGAASNQYPFMTAVAFATAAFSTLTFIVMELRKLR